MKPSSAKQKGRVACKQVQELLYRYAPDLAPGDIEVTSSGATGEDLKLSPAAKRVYPIVCEVKNQESLSIWSALEQAEGHLKTNETLIPVLFFKRNHSKLYATVEADKLIRAISLIHQLAKGRG